MKHIIRNPWAAESQDSALERGSKLFQAKTWNKPNCFLLALTIMSFASPVRSQNSLAQPDLTELSIETLLGIEVTSVARHSEKLSQSPAAISVITEDDIRRSRALCIPEALRLVPGREVAGVASIQLASSARGCNDAFSNEWPLCQYVRSIDSSL